MSKDYTNMTTIELVRARNNAEDSDLKEYLHQLALSKAKEMYRG